MSMDLLAVARLPHTVDKKFQNQIDSSNYVTFGPITSLLI